VEGADSHARQRWRRANLNEALELVSLKEQVLSFDPAHQGCKPVLAIQQGEPMQASVTFCRHSGASQRSSTHLRRTFERRGDKKQL
jgi:hypothetical protein